MFSQLLHSSATVTLSSLHAQCFRSLNSSIFKHQFPLNYPKRQFLNLHHHRPTVICAEKSSSVGGLQENWKQLLEKWSPKNFLGAEKVFRLISGATSSPIAQYIPSPTTFLHSTDPRIKLVQSFNPFGFVSFLFKIMIFFCFQLFPWIVIWWLNW